MLELKLLQHLLDDNYYIFNIKEITAKSNELGIRKQYLYFILSNLKKKNLIIPLKRGLYKISNSFKNGIVHEFEIAIHLIPDGIISHLSALSYFGFTEQLPHQINLISDKYDSKKNTIIDGVSYKITKIKKQYLFGIENIWINQTKISITNKERTMIDALHKMNLCGGFAEVFHIFKSYINKLNIGLLIKYGLQFDDSLIKRLGWILEKCGISDKKLTPLLNNQKNGYKKLDQHSTARGKYCKKWQIIENFYDN